MAFREAQSQGAALLIDEIDWLLQTRSVLQRGWEVTQVNELLQRDPVRFFGPYYLGAIFQRVGSNLQLQVPAEQSLPLRHRLVRLLNIMPGNFATVVRRLTILQTSPEPTPY